MTHQVQTSFFENCHLSNNRQYPGNFYQVIINGEDGESHEYEVEADTYAEATRQAEAFAMSLMIDITYIECYPCNYNFQNI